MKLSALTFTSVVKFKTRTKIKKSALNILINICRSLSVQNRYSKAQSRIRYLWEYEPQMSHTLGNLYALNKNGIFTKNTWLMFAFLPTSSSAVSILLDKSLLNWLQRLLALILFLLILVIYLIHMHCNTFPGLVFVNQNRTKWCCDELVNYYTLWFKVFF